MAHNISASPLGRSSVIRTGALASLTGTVLVLSGCTSQRAQQHAEKGGDAPALVESAPPTADSNSATPTSNAASGQPASPISPQDAGIVTDEEFRRMMNRVPAENVAVVIHQRDESETKRDDGRDRDIAKSATLPAVYEFAALGSYLDGAADSVRAEERASYKVMSGFAIAAAYRLKVDDGAPIRVSQVAALREQAAHEMGLWFSVPGSARSGSQEIYISKGLEAIKDVSSAAGSGAQVSAADALKDALPRLMLLRHAIDTYGEKLWGEKLAGRRAETVNLLVRVLEDDLMAVEKGESLREKSTQATQHLATQARRFTQLILLGAEPLTGTLRNLSSQAGAQVIGARYTDADAFAKFLDIAAVPSSEDAVKQWMLIRELPPALFQGNADAPTRTATPEESALLLEMMNKLRLAQ